MERSRQPGTSEPIILCPISKRINDVPVLLALYGISAPSALLFLKIECPRDKILGIRCEAIDWALIDEEEYRVLMNHKPVFLL